jgi:NitT/TauT family transport system substrate-binding protein
MAIRLSENFRALFYAPFYAAHAVGAYDAEDVAVELVRSPDPASTAAALRRGDIDVMWGGPLRVLMTHALDPASDVIARDPFFIVGREQRPKFHVADLASVRFASVAEVPTPWLCLQDDLRRAGVDPAGLNRVSASGMAENAAAVRAGALDAAQLFQPYVEELVASGAGHVWYAAADRGPTAYTALVTRRPLLVSRREELLRMTRAMARTLRWIATTPGVDVARTLRDFFPDVAPDIFAASIDRYRALGLFATDPVLQREGFDRLQAAMLSGGTIAREIPYADCVDNSLAEQTVRSAGG